MVSYRYGVPLLSLVSNCFSASKNYVLHERSDLGSRDWSKVDALHPATSVKVHIALAQSNLEKGHDLLMQVSDPDSPTYGKYWTREALHDLFAPAPGSIKAVRTWLEAAGVPNNHIFLSENKQWIHFTGNISQLEDLVEAKYDVYEHSRSGKESIACDSYSLPNHIRRHVDYVTPGIPHADQVKHTFHGKRSVPTRVRIPTAENGKPILGDSKCQHYFTPECYRDLYRIPKGDKAYKGNELGIFETYGDSYAQQDLDGFFHYFAPRIPHGTTPILFRVDGGVTNISDPNDDGIESCLDLDVAYPIVFPQKIAVYQVEDNHYASKLQSKPGIFNPFLDAIDGSYCNYTAFGETGDNPKYDDVYPDPKAGGYNHSLQCGAYKPTNVISISYAVVEADLPINYQRRQCNEWMMLGLQGISVFIASGDSGVAGDGPCLGKHKTIFSPSSPVTCPYVTVVGATQLGPGQNVRAGTGQEVATNFSGGGFSNIFDIPEYQRSAVHDYLTNHSPPYKSYSSHLNDSFGEGGGVYNRNGRAYPDVSAIGNNIVIYTELEPLLIGGTSASTPLWGAIFNRINEERLAIGKSTVGFVNPALYKNAHLLNDIIEGNNPGCKTNGFFAAEGWDPVTGLGTPDYTKLLELFLNLP